MTRNPRFQGPTGRRSACVVRRAAGFTLLELLAAVAILCLLMAIVLSSLSRVRSSARSFVCKNKLRTIAFEFIQFADDYAHPWRGDSDGRQGFNLEDFQERLYGVSEFWKIPKDAAGQTPNITLPLNPAEHPMICPSGSLSLSRTSGRPCRQAIAPLANVSVGFNKNLEQISVLEGNRRIWRNVRLNRRVLAQPATPLALDVDGREATIRGVLPFYTVPPPAGVPPAAWSLWFPSNRHGDRTNAVFIGGHVLSSRSPATEGGWNWRYQPPAE